MRWSSGPAPTQRRREGRDQRTRVPRRALAQLALRPEDEAPFAGLEDDDGRLEVLVRLRYQRLVASPVAFLRGSAGRMSDDLARAPSTEIDVQLCGDAHAENFSLITTPTGRRVLDVADFDETARGPFEWDVKRLAASLVVAADHLGYAAAAQERVARAAAREYQRTIARLSRRPRMEMWHAALDADPLDRRLLALFSEPAQRRVDQVIGPVTRRTSGRAYGSLLAYRRGEPRIRLDSPHVTALDDDEARVTLARVLSRYAASLGDDRRALLAQFTPVEVAREVVGIASVGREDYVVLLLGRDAGDPLVLRVREAVASSVTRARGVEERRPAGERVVAGQRLLESAPDELLGWYDAPAGGRDRSFYVRRLDPHRAAVDLARLDRRGLEAYGRACARVLARAHARSGSSDLIAGYLGEGDRFVSAIAEFAQAYRTRNEADWRQSRRALRRGGPDGPPRGGVATSA
ncbi:MAG: DUF2252 domain-containing protein [Acidimicrobiales bacterium]